MAFNLDEVDSLIDLFSTLLCLYEFFSTNFVSLAVYFGELKSEVIMQQPAYDVPTFFSK